MAENLRIIISATDLASSALKGVGMNVIALNQAVQLGQKVFQVFSGAANLAMTAVRETVGPAAQFTEKIKEIKSLGVEKNLKTIGAEVNALSRTFGMESQSTIKAYYDAISAGISESNIEGFLRSAGRLAMVGVTDIATATDILTTTTNAYRGSLSRTTEEMADFIFATVRAGKTTVPELAASIGRLAPIAGQAGVTLEETGAAIAEITKRGVSTEEAMTALRALLTQIISPAKEVGDKAKQLGVDFSITALKTKGLVQFLNDMRPILDDDSLRMEIFAGNVRSLNAIESLAAEQGKGLNETYRQIAGSLGIVTEAAKSFEEGLAVQGRVTAESFEQIKRAIGEDLEPVIASYLNNIINPLLEQTLKQIENNKELAASFYDVGIAVAETLEFIIKLTEGVLSFDSAWFKSKTGVYLKIITQELKLLYEGMAKLVEVTNENVESDNKFVAMLDAVEADLRKKRDALLAVTEETEKAGDKTEEDTGLREDNAAAIRKQTDGLSELERYQLAYSEAVTRMNAANESAGARFAVVADSVYKLPDSYLAAAEGAAAFYDTVASRQGVIEEISWEELGLSEALVRWREALDEVQAGYNEVFNKQAMVMDFSWAVADAVGSSLRTAINSAIEGSFKLADFLKNMTKSVLKGLAAMLINWLTSWIAAQISAALIESAIHSSKIGKAAAETYAGAYAWMSGIWPPAAAGVAAAHTATMLSGQAAAYGSGVAAGTTAPVMHEGGLVSGLGDKLITAEGGELVLPRKLTADLLSLLGRSPSGKFHEGGLVISGAGGNQINMTNYFQAADITNDFVQRLVEAVNYHVEQEGGRLVSSHVLYINRAHKAEEIV